MYRAPLPQRFFVIILYQQIGICGLATRRAIPPLEKFDKELTFINGGIKRTYQPRR